jgi:enoyl-CoA hydratase/carnithine racemase
MPLARLGIVVPFDLGRKLVEVVGPAFAREILLLGQPVDAARALGMGLVHRVVARDQVERAADEWARPLAGHSPLALRAMKATVLRARGGEGSPHADLDALARQARRSADAKEGIQAMLERRRPVFRGE